VNDNIRFVCKLSRSIVQIVYFDKWYFLRIFLGTVSANITITSYIDKQDSFGYIFRRQYMAHMGLTLGYNHFDVDVGLTGFYIYRSR